MLALLPATQAQISSFPWIPGECCGTDGGIMEDFLHEVTTDLRSEASTPSSRARTAADLAEWIAPMCGYTPTQAALVAEGICSENPDRSAVFGASAMARFYSGCQITSNSPDNDPAIPNMVKAWPAWRDDFMTGQERLVRPGQTIYINFFDVIERDSNIWTNQGIACSTTYSDDRTRAVFVGVTPSIGAPFMLPPWRPNPEGTPLFINVGSGVVAGTTFALSFSIGDLNADPHFHDSPVYQYSIDILVVDECPTIQYLGEATGINHVLNAPPSGLGWTEGKLYALHSVSGTPPAGKANWNGLLIPEEVLPAGGNPTPIDQRFVDNVINSRTLGTLMVGARYPQDSHPMDNEFVDNHTISLPYLALREPMGWGYFNRSQVYSVGANCPEQSYNLKFNVAANAVFLLPFSGVEVFLGYANNVTLQKSPVSQ